MSEFRIIDTNYAFDDSSNLLALSEDLQFPASNLSHYFRSKCYRSSGYFAITTSNNKVDFKSSSGGAQLTATLTVGAYTPSDLATHIGGRMTAAGGYLNTYTVTYASTTGRWTVATSGSYLSLLWSSGTNTATSVATTIGFTAGDSTAATTYTGPSMALHTEEAVIVDIGSVEDVDTFSVLFDPRIGPKYSNDAVWTLQASNAASNWSSPSVTQVLTLDSTYDVMTHFFSSAQTYRYWRLKMVDPANPYGYVEVPKIIVGKSTQLNQLPEIGFSFQVNDQSKIQTTPYGHVYADVYPCRKVLKFNYAAMTAADIETLYSIYARLGSVVPLAIALDPTAEVYDKDRFFLYGRMRQAFEVGNRFYNFFDTDLVIEEAI